MIILFQNILFSKEFLVCNGCFWLFCKIKERSRTRSSFWCTFSAWFFHKNVPYLILYQWSKFQGHILLPSKFKFCIRPLLLTGFWIPFPTKGPKKLLMSANLSVCQFGIFFSNGSIFFSGMDQVWAERAQNDPKIGFLIFWQNVLVIPGNNLKWKVILIFHHQSHILQNSGSKVMGQNAVGQSNFRIS